jgi:UTP--glucose-1-phosphate uridylyltransferase
MSELKAQVEALPQDVKERLSHYGFDPERLFKLGSKLERGEIDSGLVTGKLTPPEPGDVMTPPAEGTPEHRAQLERGERALREGKVALVVLAGGMATRMGGVVKALVEALPGKTFLDIRLAEIDSLTRRYGKAPPFWLMTSDATDTGIKQALGKRRDGYAISTFTQNLSLRLTPDGKLFLGADSRPSEHAPGHGDLPDALRQSGLLSRFVERGGELVLITNLDNLGATLDPALIGFHLSHPHPITSEVVDKLADDRGGIPVRVDGKLRILEEFRIPETFDPQTVRVFNTNTFYVDARALVELQMNWRFFAVKKKVGDTPVIQFERIINEITGELSTMYLRLPRDGAASRFLPVKDPAELERRRPEILAVGQARGIL